MSEYRVMEGSETVPEIKAETHIEKVLEQFKKRAEHPLSKNLPECHMPLEKLWMYHTFSPDYHFKQKEVDAYNGAFPGSEKTDFLAGDPNIGWKIHLNVNPASAAEVSKYLKQNGYLHKFLSGGDIEDGKIFTVYIGSYELTSKLSQEMSAALGRHLSKPNDHSEIEFAPGVIGRFTGPRTKFHQYGSIGLSYVWDDFETSLWELQDKNTSPEEKQKIYQRLQANAFRTLKDEYGDYFYTQ